MNEFVIKPSETFEEDNFKLIPIKCEKQYECPLIIQGQKYVSLDDGQFCYCNELKGYKECFNYLECED